MATKSVKSTEALRQGMIKVRLENRMAPGVRALLNRMIRDVRVLYSASALIPDMSLYRSDWEALLGRQYRRVGDAFIGVEQKSHILAGLHVKQIGDDETQSLIEAAFLLWSKARAPRQAGFILDTTENDINEAIEEAKQMAPAELIGQARNAAVATTAAAQLLRRVPGRVGAIVNMETQAPAEQAKEFTADAIAGRPILPTQAVVVDPFVQPPEVTKEWHTVGDEIVRRAHADADLQLRDRKEAFTVGGESLKYPGDTSLGASLSNTINCRCAAIYT